jgi:hypothetical protein
MRTTAIGPILGLAMIASLMSPASASEILFAPFSQPGGAGTIGTYDGIVSVTIAGLGQALGTDYSDAFYVLTPTPTREGYWDLAFSTSPLTGNISEEASNFIVGPIPAFNPSGIYSFNLNTGVTTPTTLYFGVDDDILTDNTGAYVLVISQVVDPEGGVPEPAVWIVILAGFGLAGALLRRRVPALTG